MVLAQVTPSTDFLDILLRSSAVYLFMIAALRLFGKKELSQLSVSDLVLILLISNAVQNAMVGSDSSLAGGLMAALVLFVFNYLLKLVMFRSKKVKTLLEGEPVLLVYKGEINKQNLDEQKKTTDELQAVIREHGVADIQHVELAMLEVDGNISVLSREITGQSFHKRGHQALHPKHK